MLEHDSTIGQWFKMPADTWEAIAATYAGAWPAEMVAADLAHFRTQIEMGRREWRETTSKGSPVWYSCPTVAELILRWGWTRHQVVKLVNEQARIEQDPNGNRTEIEQESNEESPPQRDHAPNFEQESNGNRTEIEQESTRARVQEEEKNEETEDPEWLTPHAAEVWSYHRSIEVAGGRRPHKKKRKRPIERTARSVNARIREGATVAQICGVIDFVHSTTVRSWWSDNEVWALDTLLRPKHYPGLVRQAEKHGFLSGAGPATGDPLAERWAFVLSYDGRRHGGEYRMPTDLPKGPDRWAAVRIGDLGRYTRDKPQRIAEIRAEWAQRISERGEQ